jgi:hypothetical protein
MRSPLPYDRAMGMPVHSLAPGLLAILMKLLDFYFLFGDIEVGGGFDGVPKSMKLATVCGKNDGEKRK